VLFDKKIILGITGSIAAYKSATLARLLLKSGAQVQVILTHSAHDFITPLTLSTLTKRPVYSQFVMNNMGEWTNHVELGLWANLLLIAPASSHTLSRCAYGMSDDLLTATYLSAKCPVVFAPAMDLDMWKHPATQHNIELLKSYGNHIIYPASGELASGLVGEGRMEEPEEIVQFIERFFGKKRLLQNRKILVTAGPTFEKIDPVRFIGNHSSGKMGFAIAESLAEHGAEVYLVAGPVSLPTPAGNIHRINVQSAAEMKSEVEKLKSKCNAFVLSAAVADFKPAQTFDQKVKKADGGLQKIELTPTEDILKWLGENKSKDQVLIGFALETDNIKENAESKLKSKNADFIVLNQYSNENSVFGSDNNQVSILNKKGEWLDLNKTSKKDIADYIANLLQSELEKL
jgi:phosphopantothenoylcysteine decarboxylase/phosphopantothenate--cysteine ligase